MPTKPDRTENKEKLKRLKGSEKLIKKPRIAHLGHCVDFSALPPGSLPNPFTVTMTGRTLTFSTTDPVGLVIKPNPPYYSPGLNIPSDLTITVSPSTNGTVEFEVSTFAQLTWKATNSAGNSVPSVPPSPPQNIGSLAVIINGAIETILFSGNGEENMKEICYFGKY